MKVIVAQIGARHHYAIPRMLARSGDLEALYTDSCANRGAGAFLNATVPPWMRNGRLGKLLERRIDGVPRDRIRSTDRLLLDELLRPKFGDVVTNTERAGGIFSRAMMKWGTGDATHIYSMFGEGLEFLRLAKEKGLKICVDIFITPIAHRIIADERRRFPEWETPSDPNAEPLENRVAEILELADLLLCPGANVVEGVQAIARHPVNSIRIVPYGSGADFQGRANQPLVGRVLFAGTAELRKGIQYFAAAAERLKKHRWDFRVAGDVTGRVRQLAACKALSFLGRLPRGVMIEELLRADVLVLPTLAEGSASVISEALVAGLPVITTESSGSAVIHKQNGLLVSERDAECLAEAIEAVIGDRACREALAAGARATASALSEETWAKRLLAALSENGEGDRIIALAGA
jgi:glycosyltransferase involved in cell wall biosynthesis